MKRMMQMLFALLLILPVLAGCAEDVPERSQGGPGRMVMSISVTVEPREAAYERTYVTQENMNALLGLLRSMSSGKEPEVEPDVDGGQVCYTVTVTFASGEQSVYHLLGHTYLRLGDEPWSLIELEQSMKFLDFLKDHPSDNVPAPTETTASPTETTAPAE